MRSSTSGVRAVGIARGIASKAREFLFCVLALLSVPVLLAVILVGEAYERLVGCREHSCG